MCGDARRGIRDCRWDRQRFYSRLWPGAVLTCVWWQISTTKGTGGDVIILEEAAYVNPGFFYETVAPLLSMGNASFIAISTLTNEMNFYTKLISKVDPVSNTPLFKSVQIQLACQACIDAERGHECTHNMHLIPAWHTQEKHDRLRTIMSDRPDLINSEMSGVAFSSVDQCFRPPDLKRMFLTPCPIYIPVGTQLITCIDPCAGGEHSDFALVTMVHENGIFQVLGGETLQTREPDKTFALLRAHIQAVRDSSPGLYSSPVLVVVERNLGFEAEHLFRACEDIPNSYFVRENNQPSRIGVLTTLPRKQEFVTLTNVLLRESRIFAWKTSWTNVQNNGSRKVLHEQLSYFGYTFSAADNLFQKERFSISGKGAGGKDDLCMAFLIGVYVAKKLSMGESFLY